MVEPREKPRLVFQKLEPLSSLELEVPPDRADGPWIGVILAPAGDPRHARRCLSPSHPLQEQLSTTIAQFVGLLVNFAG